MTILKKDTYQFNEKAIKNTDQPPTVSDNANTTGASGGAANEQKSPSFEEERLAFEAELIDLKKKALDSAYEKGFKQGEKDGFEAGKQTGHDYFKADSQALITAISELNQHQSGIMAQAASDITALSEKVAKTIISCELTLNPTVIRDIVTSTLAYITDKNSIVIRVNPEHSDALTASLSDIKQMIPDINTVTITADPAIQVGGCIIDTKMGYVDASVTTKLDSIMTALAATLPTNQSHDPDPIDTTESVDSAYTDLEDDSA